MSPWAIPALLAEPSFVTPKTVRLDSPDWLGLTGPKLGRSWPRGGMPIISKKVKIKYAISRFTTTPAIIILVFGQKVRLAKLPLPFSLPSSPFRRTKPPIGNRLILYKVLPLRLLKTRGGKPTPNSSTVTPSRRAAVK